MAVSQNFMGGRIYFFAQKKVGKIMAKWENYITAVFNIV